MILIQKYNIVLPRNCVVCVVCWCCVSGVMVSCSLLWLFCVDGVVAGHSRIGGKSRGGIDVMEVI